MKIVQTVEIQKDFQSFRQELKSRGFFEYSRSKLIEDFARSAALFIVSLILCRLNQGFLAVVVLTLTTIDVTWWIHNASHDAIFKLKSKAFWAVEAMGIFFFGIPQIAYRHFMHRHHQSPSSVETLSSSPRSKNLGSIFLISAALAARWAIFSILFTDHLSMIWIPTLIAGLVFEFMSRLNRFEVPTSKNSAHSFVKNVFERTRNVKEKGQIWTWVCGGLNYPIEHHLFPDMPSSHYPKIAKEVKIFARYHGVPYQEARFADMLEAMKRKS